MVPKIADMALRIESARLLNYKAAALKDKGMFCFRFFFTTFFNCHVFAEKSRVFLHISQQIFPTNPEFRKQFLLYFFMNHRNIALLLRSQNRSGKKLQGCDVLK